MGNHLFPLREAESGFPKRSNTEFIWVLDLVPTSIHALAFSGNWSTSSTPPRIYFWWFSELCIRIETIFWCCHREKLWKYVFELEDLLFQDFEYFYLSFEREFIESDKEYCLLHARESTWEIEIVPEKLFSFLEIHSKKDKVSNRIISFFSSFCKNWNLFSSSHPENPPFEMVMSTIISESIRIFSHGQEWISKGQSFWKSFPRVRRYFFSMNQPSSSDSGKVFDGIGSRSEPLDSHERSSLAVSSRNLSVEEMRNFSYLIIRSHRQMESIDSFELSLRESESRVLIDTSSRSDSSNPLKISKRSEKWSISLRKRTDI